MRIYLHSCEKVSTFVDATRAANWCRHENRLLTTFYGDKDSNRFSPKQIAACLGLKFYIEVLCSCCEGLFLSFFTNPLNKFNDYQNQDEVLIRG